jgi:tripartite-type tricarboxylate transporter receptor subunit TctC
MRTPALRDGALASLLLCTCLSALAQQDYPNKPVTIISGFPPGQGVDTIARAIGAKLSKELGQAVIVENKPGAGGIIGQQFAARAAPDGYTLLITSAGPMAVNPAVYEKLPYDPVKDYAPVAGLTVVPLVLVADPAFPAKNVAELVALAKAKPGEINFASSGNGVTNHLVMEMMSAAAGIKMTHVPFKGASPAITEMISGRISLMFDTPVSVMPFIKSNRLKALAVSSPKRLAALPDVPTVAESGFPGFSGVSWMAIVAPAKTPAPIIAKLNAAITKIVNTQEMHDYFTGLAVEPMPMKPDELGGFIKSEVAKWGAAAKGAGAKVE